MCALSLLPSESRTLILCGLPAEAALESARPSGVTWTLNGNQIGDLEYAFDADGRVVSKTGSMAQTNLPAGVSGNTFNADNGMTAFNGTAMSFDTNGNVSSDGTNTYTWDARNHLTAISGAVAGIGGKLGGLGDDIGSETGTDFTPAGPAPYGGPVNYPSASAPVSGGFDVGGWAGGVVGFGNP
jgi:hypothetical protein